jgi:PAS domain S-box-containing protein
MQASDRQTIQGLLDDYLRMYAGRDGALTGRFSEEFSGFTGGGDFLVKERAQWVGITLQDFAQVKKAITLEHRDSFLQSLSDTVAVATSFFTIHLPIQDHVLSRETARLVLIFRKESAGWLIVHSSISIPYRLVREGEVYPLQELVERNRVLEELVAERTSQLTASNERLRGANEALQREVAQHQEAVARLATSEERYRSILNASPDDITIADAEGRMVMISPMALTMFGYGPETPFVGRQVLEFIHPEDRGRAAFHLRERMQGVGTGPGEYRALHRDGHVMNVEVNSEFIRSASGAPTGIVLIIRDVSERKRAEAEKGRLEALNRQLQKVDSLGRMAGAIAHHFNNHLQSVMVGIELASKEACGSGAEHLQEALASARKAAEVSNSMLTYLGQTSGAREPVDLARVCQRSLLLVRALVPAGQAIETEFPSPGPVIRANERELLQVLTNLTTNAWEAMGERRGTVRLAVRTVDAAALERAEQSSHLFPVGSRLQAGAHACLEVSDTGCGVSPENVDKLFDPFFSSKFTGRGLGLAVVLGIVRAHGGAISVESAPGRGSTFRVFLPVVQEALVQRATPHALPALVADGGVVLVVDDEPSVRRALSRLLSRLGYRVLSAEDGVAAVELFQAHGEEIRCVLCDVTMPRMGGWETLAALRKLGSSVPVILASGHSEEQVMEGHHEERPQGFLTKPFDTEALVDALAAALAAPRATLPH